MMETKAKSKVKCRFCEWSTYRRKGWPGRLNTHMIRMHPEELLKIAQEVEHLRLADDEEYEEE